MISYPPRHLLVVVVVVVVVVPKVYLTNKNESFQWWIFLCTFGSGAVGPDDPPRHLCWHIKERPCKNLTDEAEGGHTGSGGRIEMLSWFAHLPAIMEEESTSSSQEKTFSKMVLLGTVISKIEYYILPVLCHLRCTVRLLNNMTCQHARWVPVQEHSS